MNRLTFAKRFEFGTLRKRLGMTVLSCVVLASACLYAQPLDTVVSRRPVRLSNGEFTGLLSAYSAEGWTFLEFDKNGESQRTRVVSQKALVRYGDAVESRSGSGVVLADGSLLVGRVYEISAKEVLFAGEFFSAKLPASVVRAVHWHAPDLGNLRSRVAERALSDARSKDRVELVNGDMVEGSLEAQSNQLIFRAGEIPNIRVARGNDVRVMDWSEVRAIYFSRLLAPVSLPPQEQECWIGWTDGSWIHVREIDVIDSKTWSITLQCGVKILSRGSEARRDVICCVAGPGKTEADKEVVRLDSLQPLRVVQIPKFGSAQVVGNSQRIATPRFINAGTRSYHHVIAMDVGTQAIYRLPSGDGGSIRFRTDALHYEAGAETRCGAWFRMRVVGKDGRLIDVWEGKSAERDPRKDGTERLKWHEVQLPQGPALILEVGQDNGLEPAKIGLWVDPLWVGS